jgi:hypothetical protein
MCLKDGLGAEALRFRPGEAWGKHGGRFGASRVRVSVRKKIEDYYFD